MLSEGVSALEKPILLTIQRLDSTVDFSVVVVCEVAMVNSAKMTCRKKQKDKMIQV